MRRGGSEPGARAEVVAEHLARTTALVGSIEVAAIDAIAGALRAAADRRARIYTCGNGGSAAAAVHAASDLLAIPGLPAFDAVALPANLSALTAFANDVSFDEAFALQLERRVRPGDLVLAVSCSGNSPNLVRALEVARAAGAVCAGVLGNGGGKAGDLCDVTLALDCNDPIVVEGVHDVVLHAVIAALRV